MSGTDMEDLPEDTEQAIEALRRLVRKHDAISEDQAVEAVAALLEEGEVEASPEALLGLGQAEAEAEAGDAEEKESPTA